MVKCLVSPVLVVACGLAAFGSPARAQGTGPSADVREQILLTQAQLDSASRHGAIDGYAALFTEDAVVSLGTLEDIRGRSALRSVLVGFYERNVVKAHSLHTAELEVYGNSAYERGTYVFAGGAIGKPATTERGRYAAVWRRGVDGRWRIHRYLENLLPSTPAP